MSSVSRIETSSNIISQEDPSTPLQILRLMMAAFILGLQVFEIKYRDTVEKIGYLEGSKLVTANVPINGIKCLVFFTHWNWVLLGIYFLLAGCGVNNIFVLFLWELAAPNAFLVSAIVTWVLWPAELSNKRPDTKGYRRYDAICMHVTNAAFVLIEMLWAKTAINLDHWGLIPLFGCIYQLFAWWLAPRLQPKSGPVYMYFFLDTTFGWRFSCVSLLALLAVLVLFFFVAVGLTSALDKFDYYPLYQRAIVLALFWKVIVKYKD
ncbi:hypothetical protein ScalyP_jg10622 [Parmales sp. scaly parma]|nr:hypothetical protein ScalyP_jg10622 [Parmales sp. scaly parma]